MLSAVLALFNRYRIPYCLLHGWKQLGDSADVDLAIRPRDLRLVEQLLSSQKDFFCVQLYQYESTGFCFTLAAPEGQSIRFLRLDLCTHYRSQRRLFMSAAQMLAGRRLLDGVWVSSAAVELSYLLVKKALKSVVPPAQRQRLQELAEQLGTEAAGISRRLFGRAQARRLLAWIGRGEWGPLEENLPLLRKSLLRWSLLRGPGMWLRYWPAEAWRLWRRWLRPIGLSVAILGPDGSGKSALVKRLPAILRPAFPRSDAFHLRPGLLPAARKQGRTDLPHGQGARSALSSLLKLLYLVLDCNLGHLFKVRPKLARASLVCFDRYLYDLLADPRRFRHSGSSWLLSLACRMVPRPDLVLILDTPEQELLRRKQEVPPAEVVRQRRAYRELAAELPNAVLLPCEPTESLQAARAAETVLSYLRSRYSQRRRFWLASADGAEWSWLTEVLCASAAESRELPAGPRKVGKGYWQLSLRDGRGYLFPLFPPRVAAAALGLYGAQRKMARAAKGCLAVGLATGLLQAFLPRPPEARGGTPCAAFLPDHLRSTLGQEHLHFAISLGTPGKHRKPVVQVFDADGRSLACAKIGWDPETSALVGNEARILRLLKEKDLPGLRVPALLHLGDWQGRLICLQSSFPPNARKVGAEFASGYLGALRELALLDQRPSSLGESVFWQSLGKWKGRLEPGWPRMALLAKLELVERRFGALELPFYFCHGDFVPWNARLLQGKLFLFDWEYARSCWLPGYDLFHLLFQTRLLLSATKVSRVYYDVLRQMSNAPAITAYWQELRLEEEHLPLLVSLYLLERVLYHSCLNPGHYLALQRILALLEVSFASQGLLP